ncbi:hypothetical protein WSM22_32910 [Cytophagales bacterium WSM2-2]|nr:hypothetical protein WSM22_32910 [Cytophagales bacterium WSM2-2]
MKVLLVVFFLLLITSSFGQNSQTDRVVVKVTANYKPVTIALVKSKDHMSSIQTNGGKLIFKGLETAYYSFLISGTGQVAITTDSILIRNGQLLELNITVNGPCLYDHPEDKVPTCPENHTDNIIPIVYGLIGKLKDSKNVEIHLGGCVVSDCDPKFYCKTHQKEF